MDHKQKSQDQLPDLELIAVIGSLRAGSSNRAVFRAARELAPAGVTITEVEIADVPLYDGDVESEGDPTSVLELKAAVAAADGLVIFTPEYNRSVPAVTKNVVDWLSRPIGEGPLAGKPVGIVAATPGGHSAAGVRDHLAVSVGANTDLLFDESLGLGGVAGAIDGNELTDPEFRRQLGSWLRVFSDHVRPNQLPHAA